MPKDSLICDGCGQTATPEHIARRLRRLEWTTRYRPVHIANLLLGGISSQVDEEFLYAGKSAGQAGLLLEAAGISPAGKSPESVLSEFQRGGFFLTHMLECPLETNEGAQLSAEALLALRVSAVMTRIRRSLKPKRVVLISELLAPLLSRLMPAELGCPVVLDNGKPFGLDSTDVSTAARHLGEALTEAAHGKSLRSHTCPSL